jgi:hypothetical protein
MQWFIKLFVTVDM